MTLRYWFMVLFLIVSGCVVDMPSAAPQSIALGQQHLDETFSSRGTWSHYNSDTVTASVVDGVYRMLLQQPNQFVWGTNGQTYANTVAEVEITWQTEIPQGFAGVICRLNPESGLGYYGIVSQSGDFSLRYIGRNRDDAIVRWQADRRIPRSGTFRLQLRCIGNHIALYINDQYIDGDTDDRLRSGQIALTIGLPQVSLAQPLLVDFDKLSVWDAALSNR